MSRPIGFSTGSIFPESPSSSLEVLRELGAEAVELSALRMHEVDLVARALESPLLEHFEWISIHAPSRFPSVDEAPLARDLTQLAQGRFPVVLHPDTISDAAHWQPLGQLLLLENMDRRKDVGRYARDFSTFFAKLPDARLCLDLAHVRQIDPSLLEGFRFLQQFEDRLAELHVSEVSSVGSHGRMSMHSASHLRDFVGFLPGRTPAIIESVVSDDSWANELREVRKFLSHTPVA